MYLKEKEEEENISKLFLLISIYMGNITELVDQNVAKKKWHINSDCLVLSAYLASEMIGFLNFVLSTQVLSFSVQWKVFYL